ncbi:hypothetical protein PR003_g10073 [Phytophthora rubi]|uniref:Uncharacterized protein n=1 Tax=Phytophthora rubi TaxID=129364 RepID=A0A6A4FL77_9STRA|nr:hypothetical protein PR002_g17409 [Phytophthora rubi]KAE9036019.1 hypothetical protein PR001_g9029 [Phytophthora rubi]KAE9341278.1 hypothetical protein PR003_g10073 [Phytophthora rubi]
MSLPRLDDDNQAMSDRYESVFLVLVRTSRCRAPSASISCSSDCLYTLMAGTATLTQLDAALRSAFSTSIVLCSNESVKFHTCVVRDCPNLTIVRFDDDNGKEEGLAG